MSDRTMSRRAVLGAAGAGVLIGGSRLVLGQTAGDPLDRGVQSSGDRQPAAWELTNTLAFEPEAQRRLSPDRYSEIAGGDRGAFDLMTFRPRVNVPVLDMDLGVDLFGERLFAPVIVGPIAAAGRYHGEGEMALVRGAGAAHAPVVVAGPLEHSFEALGSEAHTPLWFGVYADDPGAHDDARMGVGQGARVLFITVRASRGGVASGGMPALARGEVDWGRVDDIRDGLDIPVVIKGVMTPADAMTAIERGVAGIVVSDHGGVSAATTGVPMQVLESIVDAVGGRVPVLIDGGFRRGTDVLKALILGADAVLLGRPVAWGLAAYGAEGVQRVIELVQHELARTFAMLSAENPQALTREHLRIHTRATS